MAGRPNPRRKDKSTEDIVFAHRKSWPHWGRPALDQAGDREQGTEAPWNSGCIVPSKDSILLALAQTA